MAHTVDDIERHSSAFNLWSLIIALLLLLLLIILWVNGRGPSTAGCCGAGAVGTTTSIPIPVPAEEERVRKPEAVPKAELQAPEEAETGSDNQLNLQLEESVPPPALSTSEDAAKPEEVPDPTPAAVVPPAAKLYFDTAKFELPADAEELLAPIVAYLKANAGSKAVVSGYHDPRGNRAFNEKLAKDRAKSVSAALQAAGIAEDRIQMQKPQETTGTGDLAEARRVEVSVE
jgi:outer membrane protein OmpA-like peptidoglycan-associated protein